MWALLKSLLAQWAILKLLLKSVGSLTWLLPLAFLLKAVGLPLLLLLAMLAIPLVIVLVIIGLPIILVVVVGGALMTFTLWVVSMGLLALKVAIPRVGGRGSAMGTPEFVGKAPRGADRLPGSRMAKQPPLFVTFKVIL